jgi:hypothetical protein
MSRRGLVTSNVEHFTPNVASNRGTPNDSQEDVCRAVSTSPAQWQDTERELARQIRHAATCNILGGRQDAGCDELLQVSGYAAR